MNLPDGIKHAVHMGANEALVEWLSVDPSEEELESLGSSYQSPGDDVVPPDEAKRYIDDLKKWDDGTVASSPGAKLNELIYAAGVEFARGIIAEGAKIGKVPTRAKPYMKELAPLVALMKEAMNEGSFDEEAVDLHAIIWGSESKGDDEDDD
ncbi:MAG: hypothetical protein H0T46_08375 [Deltaproteobacteria bacterium]|nr:hypothetical protein [Deltaproteobacteria bacterium]